MVRDRTGLGLHTLDSAGRAGSAPDGRVSAWRHPAEQFQTVWNGQAEIPAPIPRFVSEYAGISRVLQEDRGYDIFPGIG